ncbi:hypothetical protein ES705_25035 [subsurface metagenome]
MPIFLANLLRILTIGSVGYAGADLLNYFRAKKEGQAVATIPDTLRDVFLSWRFLLFLAVLVFGFYALLKERFKKR